jgi:ATP diphosphatase
MSDIQSLLDIMARLRDPEGGCPWDRAQNFASISPHTIEEAYEVDDAVARGDREALRDELGDLLFQVVFQARLAEEEGAFDFGQVVQAIVDKLVRRHPHVFEDAEAPRTAEAQRASWEAIKASERAARRAKHDDGTTEDLFEGIPLHLPALARSAKIEGRIEAGRPADSSEDADAGKALMRLVGRGIRDWVRLARHLRIDPEQALRLVDEETMARIRSEAHQASSSEDR